MMDDDLKQVLGVVAALLTITAAIITFNSMPTPTKVEIVQPPQQIYVPHKSVEAFKPKQVVGLNGQSILPDSTFEAPGNSQIKGLNGTPIDN